MPTAACSGPTSDAGRVPLLSARSETSMSPSIQSSPSPGPPAPAPPRSRRTFEQIFRREHINAAYVEGDSFHRYDRQEMKAAMARRASTAATSTCQPLRRRGQPASRSSRSCSASTARPAAARSASTCTTRRRPRPTVRTRARSPPGRTSTEGTDLLFYEGLHGAVVTDKVDVAQHVDLRDRRRAGHQPRVDPEAAPRQAPARLLHRGGHGDDPAPDARLRELHHARSSPGPT